jgi:hypothetical protein
MSPSGLRRAGYGPGSWFSTSGQAGHNINEKYILETEDSTPSHLFSTSQPFRRTDIHRDVGCQPGPPAPPVPAIPSHFQGFPPPPFWSVWFPRYLPIGSYFQQSLLARWFRMARELPVSFGWSQFDGFARSAIPAGLSMSLGPRRWSASASSQPDFSWRAARGLSKVPPSADSERRRPFAGTSFAELPRRDL